MLEKKPRIESWTQFLLNRFIPFFWAEFRPRLNTTMLAILAAMLVLAAQLHFGVIGASGIKGRELSIFGPYAILMAIFAIYHAARTPWLISNDHLELIKEIKNREKSLELELEDKNKTPPIIQIQVNEIYRLPVNNGRGADANGFPWDIFVAVRIELKQPAKASVATYVMEFSLHAKPIAIEAVKDLDSWMLNIWKPTGNLAEAEFNPLADQIKRGKPIEGWLHFVSPRCKPATLDECTLRIIVNLEDGESDYREFLPGLVQWNPKTEKRFKPKKAIL
jgi:hypothetical protein